MILLPAPGRYLTAPFNLTSNQVLNIPTGAMLLASQRVLDYPVLPYFPSYGSSRDIPNSTCRYGALVGAVSHHNVSVIGAGVIDGQGWPFWALHDANHKVPGTQKCSRPHLVEFEWCTEILLDGLTLRNSAFWTVHIIYSSDIVATNLTILAPVDRGNTDGINPDSSRNVFIADCLIDNGDDGVAIKSGLDEAGVAYGMPSQNITVVNVLTRGRGGIQVGSEMSGGVHDVTIRDVTLLGDRGIQIKTSRGRGGYIQNISVSNVTAPHTVREGVLLVTSYDTSHPPQTGAWPSIRNVTLIAPIHVHNCSLSCGLLPRSYCDPKTAFRFVGAVCGQPAVALV